LGLPHDQIIGATVYDLADAIPERLADIYHKKDMELIDNPGHQIYEAHVQCADDITRDYVFHKATFYDESGEVAGIVGVMLDVTERKKAEMAVLESKERLEDILHALPVGIAVIEKSSKRIVEVNPAAVTMIGLPPEQIVGKVCHHFICPSEKGKCPIDDLGMRINNAENELINFDNETIPIIKTVIPFDVDGEEYLLECFKDIRDLKEKEKEKVEKEKLQAIIEMSGSICHEMNQPLQVLSGFSEILIMGDEENKEKSSIYGTMHDQVLRISGITKRLKSITSYETKPYLRGRIVDIDRASRPDKAQIRTQTETV
jgi:PAS domain S-box-containing protein